MNGLAVDWVGGNVYWTDGVRGTIEMCDYYGNNRKVIVTGLGDPRGIALDPIRGYVTSVISL